MGNELNGTRVAFVVADEGIEQVGLQTTWGVLRAAGARLAVVAPEPGRAQMMNHLDRGDTIEVVEAETDVADSDAMVLQGGVANPDQLRTDGPGASFVRTMFEAGKPLL
jgi:protease I